MSGQVHVLKRVQLQNFFMHMLCLYFTSSSRKLRNEIVSSAGTERIDCIGKCHPGLWETFISPSKKVALVILVSQRHA